MARYKKAHDEFGHLQSGVEQAQTFYTEMADTVDSLKKNVETFVNNRRAEGARLLEDIERERARTSPRVEDREQEKLRRMMERLSSTDQKSSTTTTTPLPPAKMPPPPPPPPVPHTPSLYGQYMMREGGYPSAMSPPPNQTQYFMPPYGSYQTTGAFPPGYVAFPNTGGSYTPVPNTYMSPPPPPPPPSSSQPSQPPQPPQQQGQPVSSDPWAGLSAWK